MLCPKELAKTNVRLGQLKNKSLTTTHISVDQGQRKFETIFLQTLSTRVNPNVDSYIYIFVFYDNWDEIAGSVVVMSWHFS